MLKFCSSVLFLDIPLGVFLAPFIPVNKEFFIFAQNVLIFASERFSRVGLAPSSLHAQMSLLTYFGNQKKPNGGWD
jgi:hypothetical protein